MDTHDAGIEEATAIDIATREVRVSNDTILNGTEANGTALNGWRLNGWRLNGLSLGDTSFSGTHESDGSTVSGTDLVGSELEGELASGGSVGLRIAAITPSGTPGLNYYTVEYLDGGTWKTSAGTVPRPFP